MFCFYLGLYNLYLGLQGLEFPSNHQQAAGVTPDNLLGPGVHGEGFRVGSRILGLSCCARPYGAKGMQKANEGFAGRIAEKERTQASLAGSKLTDWDPCYPLLP